MGLKADKIKIAKQFLEAIPHARALGLEVVEIGDGVAEMRLPYNCLLYTSPSPRDA